VFRLVRQISGWFSSHFEGRPRSGQLLLWILRGCFGAVVISVALIASRYVGGMTGNMGLAAWLTFAGILGAGAAVVIGDLCVRDKQITTVSAVYFGLLLGLLLGHILSSAVEPFLFEWDVNSPDPNPAVTIRVDKEGKVSDVRPGTASPSATKASLEHSQRKAVVNLLITVFCCYVAVSVLLQTKDEFRFIIPYVEFSRQVKGARPLVLDTSVIIDGRIADICDTRFIDTKLIVPRFVLQELQSVADSSDKLKRNRGRRGLDMLKRMQNNNKIDLVMHDANLPELREVHKVDERLVVLARALGARVVTNDYNLNKIAQLQGVEVINLNELANALKSVALPGELMIVRLVKAGDQIGQGVGYLEDGTMVVVEQSRAHIGQEVTITVTSVLQTPAGRMIFGRLESRGGVQATPPPPTRSEGRPV
jgi:uncharacterized protein YacL